MNNELPSEITALLAGPNPTQVVTWIEAQQAGSQVRNANQIFDMLLGQAAQPKAISGTACVRMCGFVDQCSSAESACLQTWAYSHETTLKLFNFYVEWNESDQHRSMALVLDLIIQLHRRNSDSKVTSATKDEMLGNLMSIVTGRSTTPAVKSAIKTLDLFLAKGIFTVAELKASYCLIRQEANGCDDSEVWKLFLADICTWMHYHFVCPMAGRLIVRVYLCLKQKDFAESAEPTIELWQPWLLNLLQQGSSLRESVKNYIVLPLFKADRKEALSLLRKINTQSPDADSSKADLNRNDLVRLLALETGKRIGLVEEPGLKNNDNEVKSFTPIMLQEDILETLMGHVSHEVRTLALSLLVTSPSTTRPYSSTALDLLRRHLGSYLADSDAKFRVDISGKIRDMFKRVRGAIFVLKRSIPRARAKAAKIKGLSNGTSEAEAATLVFRANLIHQPEAQLVHCLRYHEEFLRWYISFLRRELIPTASYQRHVASLKTLVSIFRAEADTSKSWETPDDQHLFFDLFDDKWTRTLLDLVMDPFDDVRSLSSETLTRLFSDRRYRRFALIGDGVPSQEIAWFLKRADLLAQRTARADHSDGVARAHQLLYRFSNSAEERILHVSNLITELERRLSAAERDLGNAVLGSPLHSGFAALCFTWQVVSETKFSEEELGPMRALQDRLIIASERAWSAVRDILCDDSPEGHLPEELEEVDGLDTKDVLSYSFRCIHESSNLLRTLALTGKNRGRAGFIIPSSENFARIGDLTFNQLSSLRHRGAFTTVSQTFATCCQHSKYIEENNDGQALLSKWYQGTMDAISQQASTTRRSAGIPSLMTGILSANAANPSFEHVMSTLMQIAGTAARVSETDGSNLPQVHAFNCLKDIFRNSLLTFTGHDTSKYLPECLRLAASGLKSEVWAIRNCGLIFLRSLIDYLFGTHESKAMIEVGWDGKANRIPYHKYPDLPMVILDLLESGTQLMAANPGTTVAAESVFPALDIIRRAGPPDLLREEIQEHVSKYLASSVWHVREMAARTLCSCLLHERWLAILKKLLHSAVQPVHSGQNHVHGVLLAMKSVIERLGEVSPEKLADDLVELSQFLRDLDIVHKFSNCPEVLAAYLDVVNKIWAFDVFTCRPLQIFDVALSPNTDSALLKTQTMVNRIYNLSQDSNPVPKLRQLLLGQHVGANTLVTALETLPTVWFSFSSTDGILAGLCSLYAEVCLKTQFSDVQSASLQNIASVLYQLPGSRKLDKISPSLLKQLWARLSLTDINPTLSNSIIWVSGSIVGLLKNSETISVANIKNWGLMISEAGLDDMTLDSREAAADSLASFFDAFEGPYTSEEYLPALLAVYDSLNDDDEDIRSSGSANAKRLLGESLVPIEAADSLLAWLAQNFTNSRAFRRIAASRIVGANRAAAPAAEWQSADAQLRAALEVDDSLFAVEEQNLFVDEVRETERWLAALAVLGWDPADECLVSLDRWVAGGLGRIAQLMDQEDGPLGWASNPAVFAICARVVRCAVALAGDRGSEQLRGALADARAKAETCTTHLSGFIIEALTE